MSAALPVLYSNPQALSPSSHGDARLVAKAGFDFAARANAVPIAAAEMPSAMRSYPIVFVGEDAMPVVLTGVRNDENAFVDAEGRWAEPHYVPAYIRRYPFILAGSATDERLTLCIEMDGSRVVAHAADVPDGDEGVALFDGEEPSEATKKALEFCERYQAMHAATRGVVKLLQEKNLLVPRSSTIALQGNEQRNLTDFLTVDEAKLNGLADEEYLELRRAGALPVIFAHLASMNTWQALAWQARQHRAA